MTKESFYRCDWKGDRCDRTTEQYPADPSTNWIEIQVIDAPDHSTVTTAHLCPEHGEMVRMRVGV